MNTENSTITIDAAKAKEIFQQGSSEAKRAILALVGAAALGLKITDRIKTFADVLDYHGIDPQAFDDSNYTLTPDEVAYRKLKLVALALNEGPLDTDIPWYYPVFNRNAGFGFSYTHFASWFADTGVGSRLSFKSRELAIYAGETFPDIYQPYLLTLSEKTNEEN